jgi:hypothetical protein
MERLETGKVVPLPIVQQFKANFVSLRIAELSKVADNYNRVLVDYRHTPAKPLYRASQRLSARGGFAGCVFALSLLSCPTRWIESKALCMPARKAVGFSVGDAKMPNAKPIAPAITAVIRSEISPDVVL